MITNFSEPGAGHINEDVVAHGQHPSDDRARLVAVADGQGGRPGGGAAAGLAASLILDAARATALSRLLSPSVWIDLCEDADRRLRDSVDAGYCSLVALVATADWVVGASAGDCAALLVTAGSTIDLTSRQRKHPAAGSGRAQFEPFGSALIAPWRLLVVTDGVWKPIGWDELAALVVRTPTQAIVDTLRGAAARRSGGSLMDDFSGVLLEP